MRSRVGAVDWGFALLSYGRWLRLASEEEGMGVRIAAGEDLIGQDHDKDGDHASRPRVPLSKETSDALVELPHGILEDAVEHDGLTGLKLCVS